MTPPKNKSIGIVDEKLGENVTTVAPANVYGCTIRDNCFIGPFGEIQRDVVIGRNSKNQSHSFICELVKLGDDCVVAHGVMLINERFQTGGPAKGTKALWEATVIGNRFSIGSNATILSVRICDDVHISAGAVVTRDITEAGIYAGNSARRLRRLQPSTSRSSS